MISNLQDLVSSLSTDNSSDAAVSATSKLQDAFDKLINLLGQNQSSTGTKPTLQDFLGKLISNVTSHTAQGGGGSVGPIISTKV